MNVNKYQGLGKTTAMLGIGVILSTMPLIAMDNADREIKTVVKFVRPLTYAVQDTYDNFSKTIGRNFITPITDLNKQALGIEKDVRPLTYAVQDTYDTVSKTVERKILTPINDLIEYDDTCSCTLF